MQNKYLISLMSLISLVTNFDISEWLFGREWYIEVI